jgi:ankyrin repeat protein
VSTLFLMLELLRAASEGDLPEVQRLLAAGESVHQTDAYGSTCLLWAAHMGMLTTVQWLLLEGGANIGDVDYSGQSALLLAAFRVRLPTIEWLLEAGGAHITEADRRGGTVWSLLMNR